MKYKYKKCLNFKWPSSNTKYNYNSELDNSGSHLETIYLVFRNYIVFRYFDYHVTFPYLSAASNLMLTV